MREDMRYVVIERPRTKSHHDYKGRNRSHGKTSLEDLPLREKIKQHIVDRKMSTDFLAPLVGYLEKQVGKHWDDVYSDVCKWLNKNSTMQRHVFEHLLNYVGLGTNQPYLFDEFGLPYTKAQYKREPRPVYRSKHERFFIHPKTKILCLLPEESLGEDRTEIVQFVHPTNPMCHFKKKDNGLWYCCTLSYINFTMTQLNLPGFNRQRLKLHDDFYSWDFSSQRELGAPYYMGMVLHNAWDFKGGGGETYYNYTSKNYRTAYEVNQANIIGNHYKTNHEPDRYCVQASPVSKEDMKMVKEYIELYTAQEKERLTKKRK